MTKAELIKVVQAHHARINQQLDDARKHAETKLKNISPAYKPTTREKLRSQYVTRLADIDARQAMLTFEFLYERAVALHGVKSDG